MSNRLKSTLEDRTLTAVGVFPQAVQQESSFNTILTYTVSYYTPAKRNTHTHVHVVLWYNQLGSSHNTSI